MTTYLLTPPTHIQSAQALGLPLGHMAWWLDKKGQLRQHSLPAAYRGGLMLVAVSEEIQGQPGTAARNILSVCAARQVRGVVLDIEAAPTPYLSGLIQTLESALHRQGKPLFLPERYGNFTAHACLMLSSALSGGSLQRRLEEGIHRYGAERLTLCLERSCYDFSLPAPNGEGTPLTEEELHRLQHRLDPTVFFSPHLCAHYFTYMSRTTGAHFVLFDNEVSLEKKLALAEELQIPHCFILYPEWEGKLDSRFLSAGN